MVKEFDFIRITDVSSKEIQEESTRNLLTKYIGLLRQVDPNRVPNEMLEPEFVNEFSGTRKIEFALSTKHLLTKIYIFWAKELLKVEHWGNSGLHISINYINQKSNEEFIEMNYPPLAFRPRLEFINGIHRAETSYKINYIGPVVLESERQEMPTIIACKDVNYIKGSEISSAEIFIMAEQINMHYKNRHGLTKPPFIPLILATKFE